MLKSRQQKDVQLKGNILTGYSIRRYESFSDCPSYSSVNSTIKNQQVSDWGIHILFKQSPDGSIIIGDSHEYFAADESDSLDYKTNHQINECILNEAKQILNLEEWHIEESWSGFYCQNNTQKITMKSLSPALHLVTGIGGKGMTTSAGLTEKVIEELFSKDNLTDLAIALAE